MGYRVFHSLALMQSGEPEHSRTLASPDAGDVQGCATLMSI